MRNKFPIWCGVLLFAFAAPALPALPPEPDAQFFTAHPDLADEKEIVAAAGVELAAAGFRAAENPGTAGALAGKSRELLSRRTPREWQQKAISLYPDLGVAGSEMNELFLRHYRELAASAPDFSQEPSWPVLLAKRCADELRAPKPATAARAASAPPPSAPVAAAQSAAVPPSGTSGSAGMIFAGVLLIAAALLPGLAVFWSGRFAGSHASSPWFRALKPAAVIYGVAAIAAAMRSLPDNADLGMLDRLFITLFVSIIFGACAAVAGYLFSLLYCALHPRGMHPVASIRGGGWHGHC